MLVRTLALLVILVTAGCAGAPPASYVDHGWIDIGSRDNCELRLRYERVQIRCTAL